MCSFIPKCHRFPFLVWCISGSRALLPFPVDDGAETIVASTMLPFFSKPPPPPLGQVIPDLPNGSCASPRRSSRWRESGSSSRPEPSQAPLRQGAGRSPPRKPVLHLRVAQIAERLDAVHAQHHRQRMRLSPLAAALRMRRRNAGLQVRPGVRSSIRSGKISRRFLRSHSRPAKVNCLRHRMSRFPEKA